MAGVVVGAGALVAAFVLTRGGGSSEADDVSDRIAAELQRGGMPDDKARCVGDHLVDALGTEDLGQIDFASPRMPEGLSPGFEEAFTEAQTDAIVGCEVDLDELGG